MASTYKQFLASPNSSLLAGNATLHYITTTTAIRGSTEILKHFNTVRNQLKLSTGEVLDAIEGENALAYQVKTSLKFITSGGPYLPGLDDNFLAEREVHLPVLHIVSFDNEGKIVQIRQSWDQGALLKQVDVIGKSGRNWPIRDSNEQIRAISTCSKAPEVIDVGPAAASNNRARGNSNNAMRDPHASLELFAPREEVDKVQTRVVSPYAGTRPRERSISQILGNESDNEDESSGRSQSPSKAIAPKGGSHKHYKPSRLFEGDEEDEEEESSGRGRSRPIAPKIGAGKNYQPSRLFDAQDGTPEDDSPVNKAKVDRFVRPHPTKFNHFDFADQHEPVAPPPRSRSRSKHDSSWSFDDFVTPQKALPTRALRQDRDVRHWDPETDSASDVPFKPAVKPLRRAEAQFEFDDSGSAQSGPRRGGADTLGNITNLSDRRKDFDSHWDMTDEPEGDVTPQPRKVGDDRKKAVKMMEANWAATDESPRQSSNARIAIAGDGMGSRKVATSGSGKGAHGGIHIAGDGMGGKKGTTRSWIYPDED
ncbi:uncharacterized protein DNG_00523 [Cephalotrichum gorgonifer]|uniref:Ntf2-like protein n=1 Tax=Cephalotrichum gorgonifer TaxID=2041049 RepID=A0AAE8MRF9_9PEZI|nr:uncharacterized protein DNG_00523 [Cephalotrichum gorgonifer]